ncbi:MAG TPA: hypothetical protein VG367_03570 [Mucilaginibacter sp.]|jgi:hypothetical protein|nr:hypothetical protein [Mucilaginibacter sp.]
MITTENIRKVADLHYAFIPDDEDAFITLLNKSFSGLRLDELLNGYESLLSSFSTPPDDKQIRFFDQPVPWVRIQYYSSNFLDEDKGLVLSRIFCYESDKLIVEHEYFVLPGMARGQNIGKKLLAMSLEHYERMGVKEIRVFAGLSDGGLVWAKVGFKATDKAEIDTMLKLAKKQLTKEQYEDIKAIYDLYYTIEPDGTAFPIKDWALLGFMDGILKKVDWHGRIDLTNEKELSNFKKYVNR